LSAGVKQTEFFHNRNRNLKTSKALFKS